MMMEEMYAERVHPGEWVKLVLRFAGNEMIYVRCIGENQYEATFNKKLASWFSGSKAAEVAQFVRIPAYGRREWLN